MVEMLRVVKSFKDLPFYEHATMEFFFNENKNNSIGEEGKVRQVDFNGWFFQCVCKNNNNWALLFLQ